MLRILQIKTENNGYQFDGHEGKGLGKLFVRPTEQRITCLKSEKIENEK